MKGKYRKSVFVVAYSKTGDKIRYLLLKRKLHWKGWEFPKGGAKYSEPGMKTARREIKEETGLKILRIKRFSVRGAYKYKKTFPDRGGYKGQSYVLYAVETKKGKVKIDRKEHLGYKWLEF